MHCDPSLSFLGLLGARDEVGFTVRRQSIPSRVTLFKKFFFRIFFLAALELCCFAQASSSFGEWGLLSSCGAWAFH